MIGVDGSDGFEPVLGDFKSLPLPIGLLTRGHRFLTLARRAGSRSTSGTEA